MRLFDDQLDERLAAQVARQLPGRRLVDPHERRLDRETAVHAERERNLRRLDRVVAAIRVAGEIGLAHAADEYVVGPSISDGGSQGEKDEIAAGHERVRQLRLLHLEFHLAGERGLADLAEEAEIQQVAFAEPRSPLRKGGGQQLQDALARIELGSMALAVVETDGLDTLVAPERPGQPGPGVLSSREEHQGGTMHRK